MHVSAVPSRCDLCVLVPIVDNCGYRLQIRLIVRIAVVTPRHAALIGAVALAVVLIIRKRAAQYQRMGSSTITEGCQSDANFASIVSACCLFKAACNCLMIASRP